MGTVPDKPPATRRRERSRSAVPQAPPPGRPVGRHATARGAIASPEAGFTAQQFAALVDQLVDDGSREHYADAALYDYEYRRRRADVTFYRELARRRGADRILELGAGTGRVTVPLARDGRQVVAVDRSDAMLGRLRARITRLPAPVAARITPMAGDLRSFSAGGRFPLVIAAFNVLEHLYTGSEVVTCLQRVAAHLAPGGAFAFDVQLPDLLWLARDPSRRWARTRFTDPTTGRTMYYSTNHDYDPVRQIAMIRLYYEPAEPAAPPGAPTPGPRARRGRRAAAGGGDPGGADPDRLTGTLGPGAVPGETRVIQLSQRKFFPAELEALVAHAGFRVVARYGDFSFQPLDGTADSQVLVCEPVAQSARRRPSSR
ncbi:MAG TPA: class I SAM-dependent methyltransferase [Kofleriaceae bacterium]|jgi:SAM-dependent methyltransferase|nr:class I SAM-dependent methyltransferase [Kofleriaceae bacterium]